MSSTLLVAKMAEAGRVPPLANGDWLKRDEFHRRYLAMGSLKKAELIQNAVYMPSPVSAQRHGAPHSTVVGWLFDYAAHTLGVQVCDNSTVILDENNEPQPDVLLRRATEHGGQSQLGPDGYIHGAEAWVGRRRMKVDHNSWIQPALARARSRCLGFYLLSAVLLAAAPAAPLPRSTPEAQGVSSAGIEAFIEAANQKIDTLHSVMIVRHGQVIAEGWWKPESPETPHVLHSLSKSFTSTAVGLAIGEGKLAIDDPVVKFFPDDVPAEPSENLRAMRVRDLLTMSTGNESEVKFTPETPWVQAFLAHPVPRAPGSHFMYNSPATHMLSAIVQKVSGQTVLDYLRPRLFEPLGIEHPEWGTSPQGITQGGWGLKIRTEDIAKFGLLYAQRGRWNGRQLLPETWTDQATARQVANGTDPAKDWTQGYGYQFWRCRHGAYRGDGAFGQFCIVLPQHDTVIAITADTKDMQAELNVVWDHLLPAIQAEARPADDEALAKLKTTLANLAVPTAHSENSIRLPGAK